MVESVRVTATGEAGTVKDGLAVIERIMSRFKPVPVPGAPSFTGGAVGVIGYEFIHDVEPIVPRPPRDELGTPTLYFLIADEVLVFDRVAQTFTIVVNAVIDERGAAAAYEDACDEIERLLIAGLRQKQLQPQLESPRFSEESGFTAGGASHGSIWIAPATAKGRSHSRFSTATRKKSAPRFKILILVSG